MNIQSASKRRIILNRELDRIVQLIISVYKPDKIVLFGSLAAGQIDEASDIDLLIIKNTTKRPIDRCIELAKICHPKTGVDFFIYTPAEYVMLLDEKYSFLMNALENSKILYEKRNHRVA